MKSDDESISVIVWSCCIIQLTKFSLLTGIHQ